MYQFPRMLRVECQETENPGTDTAFRKLLRRDIIAALSNIPIPKRILFDIGIFDMNYKNSPITLIKEKLI